MNLLYAFPETLPIPRARGVQVAHTLAALLDAGVEVCLAYTPEDAHADPLADYGLHPHNELQRLALSRRAPAPFAGLPIRSNRFYNSQLYNWLKRARTNGTVPDAILTRHFKTAYALLQANLGIPLVYEAHEIFALSAKPKHRAAFTRMEAFVLEQAALVIAISRALADGLREHYGVTRPFDILHSGVTLSDTPTFTKPWTDCARHIIYAGSLFGWKGVEDLIAAARWLPGHRLAIIGGNAEEIAALRQSAPRQGAEIVFKGQRSHADVQAELAAACIAVLPNRAGSISAWTSPIKLFEYMGAGCAVVASDLPAIREILEPDEALLVPAQDPQALATAIRSLTNDPELAAAQGAHLRERAAEFTWEVRGKRLADIIHQTTSAKK